MQVWLTRFPLLRRVPVVALGITAGCLLALFVFNEPVVQARGSVGAMAAVSQCGGEGQRACCALENLAIGACSNGLVRQLGCTGDCACPDIFGNASDTNSSDTCVAPAACGGEGQPACANGLDRTCNAGLTKVPGCSGDCNVQNGANTSDDGVLSGFTCARLPAQPISEPTTNAIAEARPANSCSLAGYADLHLHLFSDLAHGGAVLGGKPYDYDSGGGINEALGPDFTTARPLEKKDKSGMVDPPVLCDQNLYGADCFDTFFHGDHDLLFGDSVGAGTKDGAESNFGAPIFNGWPKWTSTTHQQAYYKWLERAWQGGLRLVTMLAVTNEALCRGSRRVPGVDCEDSMGPIYQQLQAAKDFEQWLNNQGQTWFKIVYSPAEARMAIARGQLAVVLGVETAELFNCKFPMSQCTTFSAPLAFGGSDSGFLTSCTFSSTTNDRPLASDSQAAISACTPASIDAKVQQLYDAGARHVFPIHNFDNAFGGSATWQTAIEIGNRAVEGHWWKTRECKAEGYDFKLGGVFDAFSQALIGLVGFGQVFAVPVKPEDASCNEFGLMPLGDALMQSLMKRGMIIDVDHMSVRALNDTLDIMENPGTLLPGRTEKYPVVATHVLLREGHASTPLHTLHERLRTKAQLERIRDVGGMVAAMLKDDVQDTDNKGRRVTWQLPQDWVPLSSWAFDSGGGMSLFDDCQHSSKSFAVAYMNLAWIMRRPVGFGSDFNGTAGHFGPRFGSEGCGGVPPVVVGDPLDPVMTEYLASNFASHTLSRVQQYRRNQRVSYPFDLPGFGSFFKQVTGKKVFDYNFDGLAHIGLLPDFVQDLKVIGMDAPQAQGPPGQGTFVNMMFNSAEEYIRVWEKSMGVEPIDACALLNDTDPPTIDVDITPPANAAGWHKSDVTVTWTVTDPSGVSTKTGCDATTLTTDTAVGGVTLTCTATDNAARTAERSVTIKLDETAPDIVFGGLMPPPNQHGWNNTPVALDAAISDSLSGLAPGTPSTKTLSFIVDTNGQVQSVSATDVAGNTRIVVSPAVRIDRVAPTLVFGSASPAANVNGWHNAPVTVPVAFQDDRSGIDPATEPDASILFSNEGAAITGSVTVFDRAGNAVTRETPPLKIDLTPPAVTAARAPLANVHGWNNTDVTAHFTASDALSGLALDASPIDKVLSNEGAGQSSSHTFTDLAGNTRTASLGNINIDKTAPAIAGSPDRAPNAFDWYNANVTVSFACGDALSGVLSCPPASTLMAEGAGLSTSGMVTDRAGNSASTTVGGINIDKTAPTIVASPDRAPNANGWYNADVTVSFACNDGLSGVQTCSPPSTLSAEAVNQSATGLVTDRAGNTASTTFGGIKIDKTAPIVTCTNDGPMIWPPNHKMVAVKTTVGVDGGLSGSGGFTLTAAASNEPANGLGDGDTAPDLSGWMVGTPSTTGSVRAERSGTGAGRIYSLNYRGLDLAGNAAACLTTIVVPHDQGKRK